MFFYTGDEKKNRLCFYLRGYTGERRAVSPAHTSYCDRGWIFAEKNDSLVIGKMEKNHEFPIYPFKYISKNRNVNIFSYVMKYIVKEFANVNLTTVLLFSVRGKAYTMSQRLSRLISGKIVDVAEKKYKYIDTFEAQDLFYGYNIHDYDPASLTFFFSFISDEEKTKLLSEGMSQAEALEKKQEERRKVDERDAEANKKNDIAIINMIKIK